MTMNIYLDKMGNEVPGDWHHCTSVSDVISLLKQSPGSSISIDYTNGIILLRWLYDQLKQNTNFVLPIVHIHIMEASKQKELYNLYCVCLDQDWHNHQIKLNYTDYQTVFVSSLFLWSCVAVAWLYFLPVWSIILLVPFAYLNISTTYHAWHKYYKLLEGKEKHDLH